MSELQLTIKYQEFSSASEMSAEDQELVQEDIPEQENAAYPSGLCAERTAMFWAGANYPDVPLDTLAIAGSDHGVLCESPASPCGSCRQVMAEYQKKHKRPLKVILVGSQRIRKFSCVDDLLPFIFDSLHME